MTLFGAYDAGRLIELGRSWRAEAVVAQEITETWDGFGMTQGLPRHTWARPPVACRGGSSGCSPSSPKLLRRQGGRRRVTVLPRRRDRVDVVRASPSHP